MCQGFFARDRCLTVGGFAAAQCGKAPSYRVLSHFAGAMLPLGSRGVASNSILSAFG